MENIFQSAQFWTVVVFALIALSYVCVIYKRDTLSAFEYLVHGLILIGASTFMVAVLAYMNAAAKISLNAQSYETFSLPSQIALYFLPLISAAIGCNLVSQAITEKHSRN